MDIQTAILALAAGNLVFGLILAVFQLSEPRSRKIPFWTTAKLLQGAGYLLLYLRGTVPDWASILAANIILFCGFAWECWAFLRLSGRDAGRTLRAGSVVVLAAGWFLVSYASPATRIAAASLIAAFFFGLAGWATLSYRHRSLLRTYLGLSMWAFTAIMFARAAWAVLAPGDIVLFTGSIAQYALFGFQYYMMLTSGFGVLLLARQRTDWELDAALREQRAVFETLPTGIWILRDRIIETCNPGLEVILGYPRGTLPGHTTRDFYQSDAAFEESGERIYRIIAETGRFEGEVVLVRRDGERFHAWLQGTTIFPEREEAYSVFSVTDISATRHAAEEIKRLNAELEKRVLTRTAQRDAVNRELEAFAYSAAHDLRAPLRAIDGFSEIVAEEAAERLSPQDLDHLARVRAAAQRMGSMIDDLAELSQTTSRPLARQRVDMSALSAEVAKELCAAAPARHVDLVIAPGLSASADPTLLRRILAELLENAWKFTCREDEARVEVGVIEGVADGPDGGHAGEPAFYVRDNGAGFDMDHAAHLFGAFQRMHSPDEFEGDGIGLAAVHRLVNRHGGRVWAEAEVGKGARFFFTLPDESTGG